MNGETMTRTEEELIEKIEELIIELREAEAYYFVDIKYDINRLSEVKLKKLQKEIKTKIELYNQRNLFKKYGV